MENKSISGQKGICARIAYLVMRNESSGRRENAQDGGSGEAALRGKGDGEDEQPSVSARGKKEKESDSEKDRKQARGSKTAHQQQGGLLFCPSQPIVLFAKGENVNPLWKEELGGFTLSILISGNSLIWGGGGWLGNG